jgi:hypothetical protein
MADVPITTTTVIPGAHARIENDQVAGQASLTAGMTVYKDTTDSDRIKKAAAATQAEARARGFLLNNCGTGQRCSVQWGGRLTMDGLTKGTAYYVSDDAHVSGSDGGLCPEADLGAGDYRCFMGIAESTTSLVMPESGPLFTDATA